jgi:eukaryotic-like serine/threonine-protein kinase
MSTVGQRVGPYEIAALLGQGGMGVVYKAVDTRNGSTVALKSLPRADPAALYRFKQEFRSLADISHPNLASLYELISLDGAWWLAMEFVDGVDLLSYVSGTRGQAAPASTSDDEETSATPVPRNEAGAGGVPPSSGGRADAPAPPDRHPAAAIGPEEVSRLRSALAQLAGALDALDANDTLHRDIKPSNVMVDATGRTVLLDFGLATAMSGPDANHEQGEFVGTVDYMAPEQASSLPLSPAADWYAVGVMLFRALAGRRRCSGPARSTITRPSRSTHTHARPAQVPRRRRFTRLACGRGSDEPQVSQLRRVSASAARTPRECRVNVVSSVVSNVRGNFGAAAMTGPVFGLGGDAHGVR